MRRSAIVLPLALLVQLSAMSAFLAMSTPGARANEAHDGVVLLHANALFNRDTTARRASLQWLVTRGDKDAIPALIQALRFSGEDRPLLLDALGRLAGESAGSTWHDWMLWQEARPDIKPFARFAEFKAALYRQIDPNFDLFLYKDVPHDIRLEEITWGGVRKDGIPALTNPNLIAARAATYLTDNELVFGVEINGDARAYPLRILDWHEMFNDVVGGVPVSLAYCTLCGSGILFETTVEGREEPFVFGSSGFLYRSNKLMYDTETNSLWNQFTGRPVVGSLTGSDIELNTRPVVITSWSAWHESQPDTKVLSLNTGFVRDYTPGAPYGDYFTSPDLMFPALVDRSKLEAKDFVFALRGSAHEKAWPLALFDGGAVLNDTAGILNVTLIGDAATRTVRAYRTGGEAFAAGADASTLTENDRTWQVTEVALVGPDGTSLPRLPGHIAFWFAWSGFLGEDGELATAED